MIKYKLVPKQIQEKQFDKYICDKCKVDFNHDHVDFIDLQEFHSFGGTGGYGSLFGDMSRWSIDLCDKCCYGLFKDYIQYDPYENEE